VQQVQQVQQLLRPKAWRHTNRFSVANLSAHFEYQDSDRAVELR